MANLCESIVVPSLFEIIVEPLRYALLRIRGFSEGDLHGAIELCVRFNIISSQTIRNVNKTIFFL